jgi:hypothetical protein
MGERGLGSEGLAAGTTVHCPGGPAGILPDGFVNLLEHGVRILEDLLVREAKDREPEGSEIEIPVLVMGGLKPILVDGAVELNDELVAMAVEIRDVAADWHLAAELQTEEIAISKQSPEGFFGGCLRLPQLTGASGLLRVPHLPASSPCLLPTPAGEWRRRTRANRSCRGLRVPSFEKDTCVRYQMSLLCELLPLSQTKRV